MGTTELSKKEASKGPNSSRDIKAIKVLSWPNRNRTEGVPAARSFSAVERNSSSNGEAPATFRGSAHPLLWLNFQSSISARTAASSSVKTRGKELSGMPVPGR